MKKIIPLLLAIIPLICFAQKDEDPSKDAFGRLRISEPQSLFDAQFTYDRQPLLFDTITIGDSVSISYDNTNKEVDLIMANALPGHSVGMQSFEFFRYQPGKSQLILITFNAGGGVPGVEKVYGYSDGTNGVEFVLDGTTPKFRIISGTDSGTEEVSRSNWNIDKLEDGIFYGRKGDKIKLDFTKTQILVIDLEALYVGRVRVGFDIGGKVYYAHEFNHSNVKTSAYIQSANLPIRAVMTATDTVSTSMSLICSSVMSEAGQEQNYAYHFSTEGIVTAGNGTDTHILSIQPRDSFANSINRSSINMGDIRLINTGNADVIYKVVIGQAITTPTTADVNSTYSAAEKLTAGALSGSPAIVIDQGYIPAGAASASGYFSSSSNLKTPITLRHDGSQRDLGKVTILVQGISGTSAVRCVASWDEIR